MNHTSPAIVSQTAVRRLPRLALLLFCAAYVLPGFIGREPWKNADVSAFGVMYQLAQGNTSWWHPSFLGAPLEDAGALPYWLGALSIQVFSFLPADLAARLPFLLLLILTLSGTWYAIFNLARQKAAQPVMFAFGGEAHPTDYARALADAGLLALVACLGLAQLSHETTPAMARLAPVAGLLFAASRFALPGNGRTDWLAMLIWAASSAALAMGGGAVLAGFLGTGLLVFSYLTLQQQQQREATASTATPLVLALGILAVCVGLAHQTGQINTPPVRFPTDFSEWQRWLRLLVWFTWPAWPLAMWTLWGWRRQLLRAHVVLPLWTALTSIFTSAVNPAFDRALLLGLPGFAALAAFALPTLRRSFSALIDWFTLIFFTGCALVIWVVWMSMMTGFPAKPAANVARLAPGFTPSFSFWLFFFGALATLAWLWLVSWRVGRHRQAIWKSLVLPAAGATLCWLLLMTLWLPMLDFARSYGPIARRVALILPKISCVAADGLSQAQMASLIYQGNMDIRRIETPDAQDCQALVVAEEQQPSLSERIELTEWAYRAKVHRLNSRQEAILVYIRLSP
ncbi:hypothetical protein [Hydrogenophaga sp. 5NK40-0174]|uniref:hypothetical protein n=1 Tax=Hydrogenophaga sp. 5NK40-0174 TaxID=3127649 RepID=UPI003102250C